MDELTELSSCLDVMPDDGIEHVAEMRTRIEALLSKTTQRLRELRKEADEQLIAWINRNGPLTIGQTTYFVGIERKTRCVDIHEAVKAVLESEGVDAVVSMIASDGIKHGAARKLMPPDVYERTFITTEKRTINEKQPHSLIKTYNKEIE